MCLVTFQKQATETKSPIKCYKIMSREVINGDTKFFSFFQRFEYSLNKLYSLKISDLIDFEDPINHSFDALFGETYLPKNLKYEEKPDKVYRIYHGFHSYENLEYSETLAKIYELYIHYIHERHNMLCIFECEIPTGAKLYKGVDNSYDDWMCNNPELIDKSLCYCSDKIKILRWKSLHDSDWHEAKINLIELK